LMWLFHNSRWGPKRKNERQKESEREKMFETFDFIVNLKVEGGSFPAKEENLQCN